VGTTRIQRQFDLFNAFNRRAVLDVRSSDYGMTAYLQPSRAAGPRPVRLGFQIQC
jgi:hypothetical protein